jgi:hypothetical protein
MDWWSPGLENYINTNLTNWFHEAYNSEKFASAIQSVIYMSSDVQHLSICFTERKFVVLFHGVGFQLSTWSDQKENYE